MDKKNIAVIIFYWVTFLLSCLAAFLKVGLVLLLFGIFILALFGIHFFIGLKITEHKLSNKMLLLSSSNLLLFSLIRIDGVHAIDGNGLSTLLEIFDIYIGIGSTGGDIFLLATPILFFIQMYLEAHLLNKWKSFNRKD